MLSNTSVFMGGTHMVKGMISVIVPIYNVADYLKKCLDSILAQSYTNLEIICIDDGSVDGSGEIAEKYAAANENVKVIRQKNAGVSRARNVGLSMIRGEYFGFVDADDYISKDMYRILFEAIEEEKADISACAYSFDKKGEIVRTENKKNVKENTISVERFMKYIYHRDVYKAVGGYTVTRLFRTSTFREKGIWKVAFDEMITNGEDALFLAHCVVNSKKMIYKNQYMYFYVQRSESASHNYIQRVKGMTSLYAYQKIIETYEKNGFRKIQTMWIKRFLVYHASLLAEYAAKLEMYENNREIAKYIGKYLPEYILTNLNNPKRVIRIFKLLYFCNVYKGDKNVIRND